MTEKPLKHSSGCPVAYALSVFGDHWSLLIVRDLAVRGSKTFGELQNGWEGISTNILTQRLRHLEDHGVITQGPNPENWRSKVYALTDKGRALAPLISELILWGGTYNEAPDPMTDSLTKVQKDRTGFEEAILKGRLP